MSSYNDLINAFITHQPTIYKHILNSLVLGKNDLDFFRLDKVSWSKCKNISIDYAILEKVKNVIAIPYNGNWSDMGDWNSVWEEVKKDKHGMAIKGNVTYHDCKNTLLRTENDGPELVGIGLENLISIAIWIPFAQGLQTPSIPTLFLKTQLGLPQC